MKAGTGVSTEKIKVATKLRVEEQKGGRNLKRNQTKSLLRNGSCDRLLIKDHKRCRDINMRSRPGIEVGRRKLVATKNLGCDQKKRNEHQKRSRHHFEVVT